MTRTTGGVRRRVLVLAALLSATVVTVGGQGVASANVNTVSGRAYGYYANVGFFGGPQSVRGYGQTIPPGTTASQSPSVTLPSSGGNLTASDPDGADAVFGPAHLFESQGAMTVHTEGATGATGSVTSSASVNDIEPNDPFLAPAPGGVSSTCTATETGQSGSTTITGGRLVLRNPNSETVGELGEIIVTVPTNPAPNTEYEGIVANVYDYFTVVFNEQIRTPDSITVNAVHMYLEGPTAVGDMIIASSQCGVAGTTTNQAPVANDEVYSTRAGQAVIVSAPGLLANDTDPEGGALTASKVLPTPPPTSGTVCAPYPTRCNVWPSPSKPANGSLTLNADGSFTYQPNPCFAGVDTFSYVASDPRGKSDTATVSVTVTSPAYLSISDAWVTEGNAGSSTANFVVTRCGDTSGTSTVKYKTTNGTATAGVDYTALALTTLTFAPGETSKPVAVTVAGDTAAEPSETFNVALSSATNATVSDTTGVGTIVNDDALSYLTVADVVFTEGNAGNTNLNFTITRSGNTTGSSTVSYKTANGTAAAGSDYVAVALTPVTFAPGETTKPVAVPVTGDTLDEVNETFSLSLSAASAGTVISDATGTATIVDDDGAVTSGPTTFYSVNDISVTEGNGGPVSASFTVTRSGNTSGTGSVKYKTTNGTAIGGPAPLPGDPPTGDFLAVSSTVNVPFAAGETSKTVSITVHGDNNTEVDETFKLTLSSAVGGTLSDNSGTATILNDEFAWLSVTDAGVTEGNGGTTTAVFYVTRSGNISGTASAKYATTPATATTPADFTAVPLTTVFFDVGETAKVVTVNVVPDTTLEPNETFKLTLSAQVGGSLADNSGLATVFNDDA